MASLADRVKRAILQQGLKEFVEKYSVITSINEQTGEMRCRCVAHADDTPSASMRAEDGVWNCFVPSCGASGDLVAFYCFATQTEDLTDGIRQLAIEYGLIPDIRPQVVDDNHARLLQKPAYIEGVHKALGIGIETMKRFRVGVVARYVKEIKGEAIFIAFPVKGSSGEYEDIRLYNRQLDPKIRSWKAGTGKPKIYPLAPIVNSDTLVLLEGEKDCIRAHHEGLDIAITSTGSAGTLPADYAEMFTGKTVYICFDIDEAGQKGVAKVLRRLQRVARAIYVIDLPKEDLPANGDFSDWINLGHTKADFEGLMENARPVHVAQADEVAEPSSPSADGQGTPGEEPLLIDFRDISRHSSYRGAIKFMAHTIGVSASMKSYTVPKSLQVTCGRDQTMCLSCSANQRGTSPPVIIPLDLRMERSLEMFRCTTAQADKASRELGGIAVKCKRTIIEPAEKATIQQMLLSSPSSLIEKREFCSDFQTAYYRGPTVPDNRDYWFTGYVQADPKTREIVLNIHHAEPARNMVENFQINKSTFEALRFFRLPENVPIGQHIDQLHQIIENDIGIYGRSDVQMGVLEAIFSVLEFWCGDKHIRNGWNEVLIIGDTRTGKSTATELMMEMINVGEFVSCENASVAGLVGGIEYIDKVPVPVWGIFPRNDAGLVALDEVDALTAREGTDIAGRLSAMRSSGRAEIQKIVQATATARVRSVWITNPRGGTKMSNFLAGAMAIEGVIPARQDIARFTKAYAINADSVPVEQITNVRPRIRDDQVRAYWNTLAILTWSLKPEWVYFKPTSVQYLRHESRRLTVKYHDAIPLIDKGSVLDKLAKLSIPIAILCGSFEMDEDKLTLHVMQEHCEYAVAHLERTYDSPEMGYYEFSKLESYRECITNEEEVREGFLYATTMPRDTARSLLETLLVCDSISARQWDDLVGLPATSRSLWSILIRNHCLRLIKNNIGAEKTPAFVRLLKIMLREIDDELVPDGTIHFSEEQLRT